MRVLASALNAALRPRAAAGFHPPLVSTASGCSTCTAAELRRRRVEDLRSLVCLHTSSDDSSKGRLARHHSLRRRLTALTVAAPLVTLGLGRPKFDELGVGLGVPR